MTREMWEGNQAIAEAAVRAGLGLYVAGGLYLGFYMRWVGRHDWRSVVALSFAVPVITFFIFESWFLVPMPKGPVEAWFGY